MTGENAWKSLRFQTKTRQFGRGRKVQAQDLYCQKEPAQVSEYLLG